MATITPDFGKGGANVASDALPSIATALRDIADDLAGFKGTAGAAATAAAVATANAATQSGSYVQADVQTIAALANSLKTQLNALITDVADLRTKLNPQTAATLKTLKG